VITNRDRVIGYFLRNPDEALTNHDMVAKWGAHKDTIHQCLLRLQASGLLARKREKGTSGFVYTPTAALLALGDPCS
jgi:DNA-binding IclR family transcriptional regulator